MAEALSNDATQTDLSVAIPRSRFGRGARIAAWSGLAVFSLLVFTIAKLPSIKIKNYVQGTIAAQLAQQNISFSVEQGYISLGLGISYVMKGVTLAFPPPEEPVKIERISVSPTFLSLLTGRLGGELEVRNGDGKLGVSFAARGGSMAGSFNAKDFDLGKLGIFPVLAGLKASALISGSGSFTGDPANLTGLSGDMDLDLRKIVIDQQNLSGFAIPRISVSEGKAQAQAAAGKVTVRSLTLGKKGSASEDIQADVSGDVGLAKFLDASTLNLNARFGLSPAVVKAFPLIDAFLGQGKQPDGTFAYKIAGTVGAPQPTPAGK